MFTVSLCFLQLITNRIIEKAVFFLKIVSFIIIFNTVGIIIFGTTVKSQTLPTGFSQVLVANGISSPTTMAFAPDGRIFIAQQTGQLRVIKNGVLLAQPFISLSVNSSGERGLLGIAFDPAFASNNYIYLYYTLQSGANNRISRFTASGDIVVPGSEVIVLNLDPLSSATNHNGGTMQFGPDGNLYVGVGENANSANAQNLDTYLGKILRIKSNGSVPTGNPFTTGSNQKLRVWQYGLRNPFTITFQPGTGRLFVNDVGQSAWEEINDATAGGLNFGWPAAEGKSSNAAFSNPVYTYSHGTGSGIGCAITGGTFFNPTTSTYPSSYIGKYFYIDYCGKWIDMLTFSGSTTTRSNFASNIAGSPVSIKMGPDGNLYFLSRDNNALYKISYTTSQAPIITSQPQSKTVATGNNATFNVTATGSAPLGYQWRKNGVNISGANSSAFTISSVTAGSAGDYSVVVSNMAGIATSNNATLTVTQPNQSPVATITTPVSGQTFSAGSLISFSGLGTDYEDGTLAANKFTWYVILHHDTHTHPGPSAPSGVTSGTFAIPNTGETSTNIFYRLYLVVTDSKGATDTTYTDITPRTSTISFITNPSGLQISLDGQPFTTPFTVSSVEGMLRTIGSLSPQFLNGNTYTFTNWSQGGTQTQTITTPVNDISYTANFSATSGIIQGLLTGSGLSSSSTVNLSTEGTTDWAHWPGYDHKSTGGNNISNYVVVGIGSVLSYTNDLRTCSWNDGTPVVSGSNKSGVYIGGIGKGFQFTAPADLTSRTLKVYVGGYISGGTLTAQLSDGSSPDYVNTSFSGTGQYNAVYTLTYRAASAGKLLTVKWVQSSGAGNVTLQAVTVSSSVSLTGSGVSSSSTVNLSTEGTADWAHWPGYDHKSGGSKISNYVVVGSGSVLNYTNDLRTCSWNDGTPVVSGSNKSGVYIGGIGKGFQFTAPADLTSRTLKVYVGGYISGGTLTAQLSDGSSQDYVNTLFSGTGQYNAVYTLTYRAASAGKLLTVKWVQSSGAGNVTLQAATLIESPATLRVLTATSNLTTKNNLNDFAKTGGNNTSFDESLTIFPNPFNDNLVLNYSGKENGKGTINLYSSEMRLIATYPFEKTSWNFNRKIAAHGLTPGIYFIQINHGATKIIKRLIKM